MKNLLSKITSEYFCTMIFIVSFFVAIVASYFHFGDVMVIAYLIMLFSIHESLNELDEKDK